MNVDEIGMGICIGVVLIIVVLFLAVAITERPYTCMNINPDIRLCNISGEAYIIEESGDFKRMVIE